MSKIKTSLAKLLKLNPGAPFLFIGSGFSRRYIGLEQWDELLKRFCTEINEFGYYASQCNNDLPRAATLMAKDFNEIWWKSKSYANSRETHKDIVREYASALKLEIANYLTDKSYVHNQNPNIIDELKALPRLNVDGIITTNWDVFLEELFPDYKVFVGQEELLFANPQSVAEIYKIHGCASQPNSLVLTQDDYDKFAAKNAYLAAKLLTIFIEHPVIFIGYSLSDNNIRSIITSIISCLGQDKLDKFGRNLIFLQRLNDSEDAGLYNNMMSIGETNINITVVKTNDFIDVYEAIEASKRKIPTRILRYCKEQMYDLVGDATHESKLAVVDIDQIENKDDIEFVVGVGVAGVQELIAKKGYQAISIDEIFDDILSDGRDYDPNEILRGVYPTLLKRPNKYIPVYKYIRQSGIADLQALKVSEHKSIESIIRKAHACKNGAYQGQFDKLCAGKSTSEIIACLSPEKAAILLIFQSDSNVDIEAIRQFLHVHRDKFRSDNSSYASFFRKLACHYDRLKFGFSI